MGEVKNNGKENKTARNSICSIHRGETLSFESNGVMIVVPYRPIARLIEECRNDRKGN